MQLECSNQSFACSVELQGTPSGVICAAVEGREILSAANASASVEDSGDRCLVRTWTASANEVCAGCGAFRRGLVHIVSGIERRGRNGWRPIVAAREGGRDGEHVST